MIKAIICKELRENYKLALAGAAVFGVLLYMNFDHTQPPLMVESLEIATMFFCGIFGALLGWLQIRRERHPDLRAFLIHRPLGGTGIFLGKVIAGLALYLFSAGVPLVCLTVLVLTPGHVRAPFDWEMMLPATASFLAGIVCYLGGILAGQTQARWPVSRSLALGAGLLAMVTLYREFSPTLLLVIVSAAILGTAAWGSFVASGNSRQGTVATGIALPFALVPGAVMLLLVAVLLFVQFVISPKRNLQSYTQTTYQVLTDGTIARISQWNNSSIGITDTNGQRLKNPNTGKFDLYGTALEQLRAPASSAMSLAELDTDQGVTFRDSSRFCVYVFDGLRSAWFYSNKRGRFIGYDKDSREFLGSIGPEGFPSNSPTSDGRFQARSTAEYYSSALSDTHSVFNVTFPVHAEMPIVNRLFTAPSNEVILSTASIMSNLYAQNVTVVTAGGVVMRNGNPTTLVATAVLSPQSVYVISPESRVLWQLPRPTDLSVGYSLQVSILRAPDQCVLMLTPSVEANRLANGQLPTRLEFYSGDSTLTKTVELPTFLPPDQPRSLQAKSLGLLLPRLSPALFDVSDVYLPTWNLFIAAVCAAVAFALGWRARLSARAQIGWIIFLLLTGVAGFFVFLCLKSWPARERCPNCRKLRVVNRDHCEHCGAPFAPADKNGIEIFEPLGTA